MRTPDLPASAAGHSAPLAHVGSRPDGKPLASSPYGGTVSVGNTCDPTRPAPLARPHHRRPANASAWNPAGPDRAGPRGRPPRGKQGRLNRLTVLPKAAAVRARMTVTLHRAAGRTAEPVTFHDLPGAQEHTACVLPHTQAPAPGAPLPATRRPATTSSTRTIGCPTRCWCSARPTGDTVLS